MTWLTPWRRRPESPAELMQAMAPFESWWRDFFEENERMPAAFSGRNLPRADVAETDKEFLVTLELPGIEENEVEVKLTGSTLTVSGERKQKKEDKDKHFHRIETTYGAFERRFELPQGARKDPESVKATFQKGLLEIRVPKAEPRPAVKIPVKAS
jgi:HSP20 family protein